MGDADGRSQVSQAGPPTPRIQTGARRKTKGRSTMRPPDLDGGRSTMRPPDLDGGKRSRISNRAQPITKVDNLAVLGKSYGARRSTKAPMAGFHIVHEQESKAPKRRASVASVRMRDLEDELFADLQRKTNRVDLLESMADELNEHHDEDVTGAKEELHLCRENVAALLLLRPDPRVEDPDSPSRHLSDPQLNPNSNTHHKPRAALYGANHHDVEALNERVAAYGELSIISALLVGAALATLVEGRTTAISGSVEFEIVAFLAEITASSVLAANIIGTAVILFQKHYTLGLMSRNFFLGANEGWDRGKPLRALAVQLISWSLPGMLVSSAFFVIGGYEVSIGNWISFTILLICAAVAAYAVITIKEDFAVGERANLHHSKKHRDTLGNIPEEAPHELDGGVLVERTHLSGEPVGCLRDSLFGYGGITGHDLAATADRISTV